MPQLFDIFLQTPPTCWAVWSKHIAMLITALHFEADEEATKGVFQSLEDAAATIGEHSIQPMLSDLEDSVGSLPEKIHLIIESAMRGMVITEGDPFMDRLLNNDDEVRQHVERLGIWSLIRLGANYLEQNGYPQWWVHVVAAPNSSADTILKFVREFIEHDKQKRKAIDAFLAALSSDGWSFMEWPEAPREFVCEPKDHYLGVKDVEGNKLGFGFSIATKGRWPDTRFSVRFDLLDSKHPLADLIVFMDMGVFKIPPITEAKVMLSETVEFANWLVPHLFSTPLNIEAAPLPLQIDDSGTITSPGAREMEEKERLECEAAQQRINEILKTVNESEEEAT